MPKIVVSYRRQDSEAITGRIRDRLANHYGDQSVFMDIDSIPFGADFRERVSEALQETDILIAVIGPKWTGVQKGGRSRIREENDPVKIEVEHALDRGIPLIPVLVNKASMPQPADLPDGLKELSYRNAATVDSGRDFHQHMDRLIRSMDQILERRSKLGGAAGAATKETAKEEAKEATNEAIKEATKDQSSGNLGGAPPELAGSAEKTEKDEKTEAPPLAAVAQEAGSQGAAAVAALPAAALSTPPAVPAKRPLPKLWLAVAAVAVICVAAAGGAYPWWKDLFKPSQPVVVQPAKTEQPTVAAYDTQCKREDGAAFYDDFKSPDGGWGQPGPNFYFDNGRMVLKPEVDASASRIYLPLLFKSAAICSEITATSDPKNPAGESGAGVVFWAADYANYYIALVYADGTYGIFRKIAGAWATVVPRTKAAAVHPWRLNVANQLKVMTGAGAANVFINGVKVVEFWGQPPTRGGSVGLFAESQSDAQTEWRFSSIAVARIDDSAAPSAKALFPARDTTLLDECKPNALVAFVDDFKPHNPGWSKSSDAVSFRDGEGVLKPTPKLATQMFFPSLVFKSGTVCADVKLPQQPTTAGSGGVIFWALDAQNYYYASIYPDGTYDVFRKIAGRWAQVRTRTAAPSIRRETGAVNRIKVAFDDDVATLTINDATIIQFRGQPAPSGGFIGLAADAPDTDNEWTFLNAVVMIDEKAAPAAPPKENPAATEAAKRCKFSPIQVAFFDDFKSPDSGWGKPSADHIFRDGSLVLSSKAETANSWIYSPLIFQNTTVCADLTSPSGLQNASGDAAGGIIFWAADSQNYYVAEVYADGTYSVYRKIAGKWVEVHQRAKNDAIRAGADAVNRLKVTTAGNYMTFFVNDKKIVDLWGQSPSRGGAVGFWAQSEPGKEEDWRFSNLVVQEDKQARPDYPQAALATSAKCDGAANLAFFDDFKSPDKIDPGWGTLGSLFALKDGTLNVTPERNRSQSLIYFPLVFTSATACLEAKSPSPIDNPSNPGTVGIIFWATDYRNHYIAGLSPDGTFGVWRRIDGEMGTVVSVAKGTMINQGPDAINQLKIVIQPNSATFYINGAVAVSFRGQPSPGTAFGIYAESGGSHEDTWRITNMAISD